MKGLARAGDGAAESRRVVQDRRREFGEETGEIVRALEEDKSKTKKTKVSHEGDIRASALSSGISQAPSGEVSRST